MPKSIQRFLWPAICLALLLISPVAQAQLGKVFGKLTSDQEPLPYNRILLKQGTSIVQQTQSDGEGKYSFARIEPGSYQLYVRSGEDERTFALEIGPGETEIKDLELFVQLEGAQFFGATKEIFPTDPMVITTIPHEEIKQGAFPRDPEDIVATLGNVVQKDHGDPLNLRGGRQGAAVTFVNGVKMVGTHGLPQASMEQISLISGGIPAEYGDATAGVIVIHTRNPGMKGWTGKPLTKAERKTLREQKKKGNKGATFFPEADWLALNQ